MKSTAQHQSKSKLSDPPNKRPSKNLSPSAAFFSTLPDLDFFSDRVQHLYFYSEVSNESVFQLQQDIHSANQGTVLDGINISPKPIVLHVNSPGGDVDAALSMLTIFNQTRVPLCTMIDGFSASAATYLTIASPYRVAASPYVVSLIHQASGGFFGSVARIASRLRLYNDIGDRIRDIYLACTTLQSDQLTELMLRDRYLDTTFCSQYHIYDRVLDIDNHASLASYRRQRTEYLELPLDILLSKSNWNRFVFSTCNGDVQRLDGFLCAPPADTKPLIYYCTPRCEQHGGFYWLSMMARMQAMQVPVYSVIESVVQIWDYLPSLFCMKRYMYAHGFLVIDMEYTTEYGNRLVDIRENSDTMLLALKTILQKKTKLPESIIRELGDRRYTFSAKMCLEYGLCDEIVPLTSHIRRFTGTNRIPTPSGAIAAFSQ